MKAAAPGWGLFRPGGPAELGREVPFPVLNVARTVSLFVATAVAELLGCYLPYLWLRRGRSALLVLPAALCLALFAWLLTLHPTASGRVYAAYGGVYVAMAVLWLWAVDGVRPSRWDLLGVSITLLGMAILMFAPRRI